MVMVSRIFILPPIAFGRVGGASAPMDNYVWRDDPTAHGAGRNVVEPAPTFEVLPDGSIWPYVPMLLRFRDGKEMRPVAPFFELWATVEYGKDDPPVVGPPGTKPRRHQPGTSADVPLTIGLLQQVGASPADVVYTVRVANRKASRRTGNDADAFEAELKVRGDDHARRLLLAHTPATPEIEPLVLADRPIPLGTFQVIRPVNASEASLGVDLGVLRVRFTPAAGQVYGPPSAISGRDGGTRRFHPIVPAANRILNSRAAWLRYSGDATYDSPQPWDTYDGASEGDNLSWGVVDDTCDGLISADVYIGQQRHSATARICVAPPDYAPDRRPFVSLADDLADRDLPAPPASTTPAAQARVADLFRRAWETADLMNLDAIRARAIGDNGNVDVALPDLPKTNDESMTGADRPYADDNLRATLRANPIDDVNLVFTRVVPLAHERLADVDLLLDFLHGQPDRVRRMIRPPFGALEELDETVESDQAPHPAHRDPRIDRDLLHDMRMPPYMRDELGRPLSLTRRQFLDLMAYVEAAEAAAQRSTGAVAAASAVRGPEPGPPSRPLDRHIERRLQQLRASHDAHAADAPEGGTP